MEKETRDFNSKEEEASKYIDQILKVCKKIYKTHKAETDKVELFKKYPHLYVFSCIMDRQIKAEQARNIPSKVADEIGGREFSYFLKKGESYYEKLFNIKKYHRFNKKAASSLCFAIQHIQKRYNGDASNIWNDNPTSAELIFRFLEFKGVGVKIATMAANILSRDYKVELRDYYSIDISPDIHVKRTMYRMGLLGDDIAQCDDFSKIDFSKIDSTKVIYRARSINPKFPGLMDLAFWEIGADKICTNSTCVASKCPFSNLCMRKGNPTVK